MSPGWKRTATAAALAAALAGCERRQAEPAPAAPAAGAEAPPAPGPAASSAPLVLPLAPPLPPSVPLVLPALPPPPRPAFGPSARLAVLPAEGEVAQVAFAADGRHAAFVVEQGGNARVWVDGQPGRAYETIRGLVVREGTGQVAYVGRRGSVEEAVVDGKVGAGYAEIGALRFAADGRVVYSARKGGGWVVVAGERERPVVTERDPEPQLGLGGQRIVYLEQAGDILGAGLRSCALDLVDCAHGPPHDGVSALRSEPGGRRWVYVVGQADRAAVAVVDLDRPGLPEQLSAWYDHVPQAGLSEDGAHLAFLASRGDEQLLVRDGGEVVLPRSDSPMLIRVSRTGRVAVLTVDGSKSVLLVDGKATGPTVDGAQEPTFSPDGKRLAYVAGAGGHSVVVSEGHRGPLHEKAVTPAFQPVGTGLVYRARQRGERFVVQANERMQTIREHPRYREVHAVAFSPDGKSVGYGVRDGKELWWKVEKLEGVGAR